MDEEVTESALSQSRIPHPNPRIRIATGASRYPGDPFYKAASRALQTAAEAVVWLASRFGLLIKGKSIESVSVSESAPSRRGGCVLSTVMSIELSGSMFVNIIHVKHRFPV